MVIELLDDEWPDWFDRRSSSSDSLRLRIKLPPLPLVRLLRWRLFGFAELLLPLLPLASPAALLLLWLPLEVFDDDDPSPPPPPPPPPPVPAAFDVAAWTAAAAAASWKGLLRGDIEPASMLVGRKMGWPLLKRWEGCWWWAWWWWC